MKEIKENVREATGCCASTQEKKEMYLILETFIYDCEETDTLTTIFYDKDTAVKYGQSSYYKELKSLKEEMGMKYIENLSEYCGYETSHKNKKWWGFYDGHKTEYKSKLIVLSPDTLWGVPVATNIPFEK